MYQEFIQKYIVDRFELTSDEKVRFLGHFENGEVHMFTKHLTRDRIGFSKCWARKIRQVYENEFKTPSILLQKLHKYGALKRYFEFLGDSYRNWLELCHLEKLEVPDFYTKGYDFREVYEVYFKEYISFKGYCHIVRDHGIPGLNNLYRFTVLCKDLNTDLCLNLRLELPILKRTASAFRTLTNESIDLLNRKYGAKRLYRLLAGINENDDVEVLLKLIDFYTQDAKQLDKLELMMPKKPKSFRDLVKAVGIKNYANFKSNYCKVEAFEQPIAVFHGKEYGGYEVFVPSSFSHMCEASFFMRNCIKSYIDKIAKGYSIIYFLKRKSRFFVCVELVQEEGSWRVNEAKAIENNPISENQKMIVTDLTDEMIEEIKKQTAA